jgi:2,4-dienoyl-CoA reductase-like NADH-dependent reductase (Old Yellow Enzyme family)
MLKVVDAVISVWAAERVGLHLSPGDQSYSVANSESKSTYEYVVQQVNPRGLAFLCIRESLVGTKQSLVDALLDKGSPPSHRVAVPTSDQKAVDCRGRRRMLSLCYSQRSSMAS